MGLLKRKTKKPWEKLLKLYNIKSFYSKKDKPKNKIKTKSLACFIVFINIIGKSATFLFDS